MFVVRVPVLSLQMTVVHPNVSTEGRDLTMAFRRAILLVPRAKHLQAKISKCYIRLTSRWISSINSIQGQLRSCLSGSLRCHNSWETFWNGCNSKSNSDLSTERNREQIHCEKNNISMKYK
jgi:hypothetical protein